MLNLPRFNEYLMKNFHKKLSVTELVWIKKPVLINFSIGSNVVFNRSQVEPSDQYLSSLSSLSALPVRVEPRIFINA